jgi:hypothetical protein
MPIDLLDREEVVAQCALGVGDGEVTEPPSWDSDYIGIGVVRQGKSQLIILWLFLFRRYGSGQDV